MWPILLLNLAFALGPSPADAPLWPGASYTHAQRREAIQRGLDFIYRTAEDEKNFDSYGTDYMWCFVTIARTSADPLIALPAWIYGLRLAYRWISLNPQLPAEHDADSVADLVMGVHAIELLGFSHPILKARLSSVAGNFPSSDYIWYDPQKQAPPDNVPESCEKCDYVQQPGVKVCPNDGRKLDHQTRLYTWYSALITTYFGKQQGIRLGARYLDVLRWLPLARRSYTRFKSDEFTDLFYAVTHVVYTVNDYGMRRLDPRLMPAEFTFLKKHLKVAIKEDDPEMMGEFLDTLKAFGLNRKHRLIQRGMAFILKNQNKDGSWGDTDEEDIYDRYHPTWTAIDGLRSYGPRPLGPADARIKSYLQGLAQRWLLPTLKK